MGFVSGFLQAKMPQNDYMDEHKRRYGVRLDHGERMRKREARAVHARAKYARKVRGLRAKLHQKKRYKEKVEMKRTIKMHEEKNKKHTVDDGKVRGGAVPAYLLERDNVSKSKVLSSMVSRSARKRRASGRSPSQRSRPFPRTRSSRSSRPESGGDGR